MNKTKSNEEKIDELYDWYKNIKKYISIWINISIWTLTIIAVTTIMYFGIKSYDYASSVWPRISIDAKFGALITLIIFILGIVVGRRSIK